jgi:hypothetical protein
MKLRLTAVALAGLLGIVAALPIMAQQGRTRDAASYYESVGIQLTAEQKAQIAAIEADAISQIDRVYTPEQGAIVTAARNAMAGIQLTAAQKQQLAKFTSNPSNDFKTILTASQQQQLRQNHRDKKVGIPFNHLGSPVEMLKAQGITLTATQETQLNDLHKSRRTAVDAIYTPEQLQTLQAARTKLQSVQLTAAQSEQIATIRSTAWKAKENVLTPAQKQKLPQN